MVSAVARSSVITLPCVHFQFALHGCDAKKQLNKRSPMGLRHDPARCNHYHSMSLKAFKDGTICVMHTFPLQ